MKRDEKLRRWLSQNRGFCKNFDEKVQMWLRNHRDKDVKWLMDYTDQLAEDYCKSWAVPYEEAKRKVEEYFSKLKMSEGKSNPPIDERIKELKKEGLNKREIVRTLYDEGYSVEEIMYHGYPPTFLKKGKKPTPPKIIITIAFKYSFSIVKTIQLIERVVAILENSKAVDIDRIELTFGKRLKEG